MIHVAAHHLIATLQIGSDGMLAKSQRLSRQRGAAQDQDHPYNSHLRTFTLFFTITLAAQTQPPSPHLANLQQLTHGGQNAEAYWSPDGKRLIFQSTRDKLECDQIFIMNADGSNQHMVSTGKGRTTCAYFL